MTLDRALPEKFAALPAQKQRRILDAALNMTQMAYRHAASTIVAPPPHKQGVLRNGTSFVLNLDDRFFLGTAWHIVEYWLKSIGKDAQFIFQVGDVRLDPSNAIAWKDLRNDLVFLHLTHDEAQQIRVSFCEPVLGWPPPHPQKGDYVLISGFPAVMRARVSAAHVDFPALSTMLQISSVSERHMVCQFEREHWISFNPSGFPPPGTNLGGLSGAPVFAVGNLAYPLIGVVSEFSSSFELLYVKTLSHLPDRLWEEA